MPSKPNFGDDLFDLSGAAEMTSAPARQLKRPDRILQMVKLSSIVADSPLQKRVVTFDPETIEDDRVLLELVKAHGVLEPIIVKQLPGEFGAELQYQMVAGHRRRAASELAGLEYIPALISKAGDDTALITLAENLGTRRLTSYELALSLVDLMKCHPDWDNATASRKTGIPAPTVSNLQCVMEKSCPALLSLFAGGTGMRVVLALQPVFDAAGTEEAQATLAELLNTFDISFQQVEMVRTLVAGGTDPLIALGMVPLRRKAGKADPEPGSQLGPETPEPAYEEASSEEDEVRGEPVPTAAELEAPAMAVAAEPVEDLPTAPSAPSRHAYFGVPDPEDGEKVRAISAATGLAELKVKEQIRNALSMGADMNVLTLACLYVAGGGDRQKAVSTAKSVAANPKVYSTVQKFQANLVKALSLAARLREDAETREMAEFLEKVFGRKLGSQERK